MAEAESPDFPTCFADAIADFEGEFSRTGPAQRVEDFALVSRDRVHHCGTLAIVACDRGPDPQGCQYALAADQQAWRDRVLTSLPAPELALGAPVLPELYGALWTLAHGASAGDDCAGADEVMAAWCAAHQARLRLTQAVTLWQVGRLKGLVGPAADQGWVESAVSLAPLPRPEGEVLP
jgi:hypothetical protein